ncbi:MAG: hypothetical protein KBT02_09010 [Treponema sp.]|nr:hypothetical protein [Candidatus Treponema caballi]
MNGVIGEIENAAQEAADRRHPPVINRVQFPEAGHDAIPCGEMLFEGSRNDDDNQATYGATPADEAKLITAAGEGDGVTTAFGFTLGEVVPGSVSVVTADTTPKKLSDNGDGTLGGASESGTGTVDYATGKVAVTFTAAPADDKAITVSAIPGSGFIGIANDSVDEDEDNGVNVVQHGTVCEGIAKYDGEAITASQAKFLARHGIW